MLGAFYPGQAYPGQATVDYSRSLAFGATLASVVALSSFAVAGAPQTFVASATADALTSGSVFAVVGGPRTFVASAAAGDLTTGSVFTSIATASRTFTLSITTDDASLAASITAGTVTPRTFAASASADSAAFSGSFQPITRVVAGPITFAATFSNNPSVIPFAFAATTGDASLSGVFAAGTPLIAGPVAFTSAFTIASPTAMNFASTISVGATSTAETFVAVAAGARIFAFSGSVGSAAFGSVFATGTPVRTGPVAFSAAFIAVAPGGVATAYAITAPSPAKGDVTVASSNFTVTPNGTYTGTITITPSGGGLSTPVVLTFLGSATPQTFTISPVLVGTVTLAPTNSGGLTNPSPVTYLGMVALGHSGTSASGNYAPSFGGQDLLANGTWLPELKRDISGDAVDPASAALLAVFATYGGNHLYLDFSATGPSGGNPQYGIPYNVVPGTQATKAVTYTVYPAASPPTSSAPSDPGPIPIPTDGSFEGYTAAGPPVNDTSGADQHILIAVRNETTGLVDKLWEFQTTWTEDAGATWKAHGGATFNIATGAQRPDDVSTAEAGGMAILPTLLRYDEVKLVIDGLKPDLGHAIRCTMPFSLGKYVWPGRCQSGASGPPNMALGGRLRLSASWYNANKTSYTGQARVIIDALYKYGLVNADNSGLGYGRGPSIEGVSDDRWDTGSTTGIGCFSTVPTSAMELIQYVPGWTHTGPTSGAVGVPQTFTVSRNPAGAANYFVNIYLTLNGGAPGGAYSTGAVPLADGSPSGTYTFTPPSPGVYTLDGAPGGQEWYPPAPITFAATGVGAVAFALTGPVGDVAAASAFTTPGLGTVLGRDSMAETSAGVLLTEHALSGAGAIGGLWTDGSNSGNQFVSVAGGLGFVGPAGVSAYAVQVGAETAANNYSFVSIKGSATGFVGGAYLLNLDTLGTISDPSGYWMCWDGVISHNWRLVKGYGNGALADIAAVSGAPSFVVGTTYQVRVKRAVNSSSSCTVTGYIDGIQVAQGTDTSANIGGAWSGVQAPGIRSYLGDACTFSFHETNSLAVPETFGLTVMPGGVTAASTFTTNITSTAFAMSGPVVDSVSASFTFTAEGVVPPPLPPDLVAAVIARIRSFNGGAVATEFGDTGLGSSNKFQSDEVQGQPGLPWLTIIEVGEPLSPETIDSDGLRHFYGNGTLQVSVFADGKLNARQLRGLIVMALNDAVLTYDDGAHMGIWVQDAGFPILPDVAPGAPKAYHAIATFTYFVDRTYT